MAAAASVAVLGAVLGLVAWGRFPDVVVTLVGAVVVVATGLVDPQEVRATVDRLGPTLAFLASIFVVAEVARRAGLFGAVGTLISRRAGDSARRLLIVVSAAAIGVTALMSLDATAVLFTAVVVHVVRERQARPDRPLLATTQLANASSSFLPVSNLTNLLVLSATGLTFGGFALRMFLPTAAAAGVVVAIMAMLPESRSELTAAGAAGLPAGEGERTSGLDGFGWFVIGVLATLVAGFFVGSAAGVDVVWIAVVGASAAALAAWATGHARPGQLLAATAPRFLVFVVGLAVVVDAAVGHGLGDVAHDVLPHGDSLPALLAMTGLAAVLANLVNNVPATLVLVSVVAPGSVGQLLALLLGVNVGPNLTYTGSLATLLWRRVVRRAGVEPPRREFFRFAVVATPPALLLSTIMLWLTLRVTG